MIVIEVMSKRKEMFRVTFNRETLTGHVSMSKLKAGAFVPERTGNDIVMSVAIDVGEICPFAVKCFAEYNALEPAMEIGLGRMGEYE